MPVHYDYSYMDYYRSNAIESFMDKLSTPRRSYQPENKEAEIGQAEWGLGLLLLRFVQMGEVDSDPRSESRLMELWKVFTDTNKDIDFTLDEVINNGWVRVVWDRWYIPSEFVYARKSDSVNKLFLFMRKLSESPYPDERKLRLNLLVPELNIHRQRYPATPDVEWFISKEIILKEDKLFYLNCSHPIVEYNSSLLLAKLWEEKIVGPTEGNGERLSWWRNYLDCFTRGWDCIKHLNGQSKEGFLEASTERLLMENDCIGWDEEEIKLTAEALSADSTRISIPTLIDEYWASPSNQELDKMNWLAMIDKSEAGRLMDRPRGLLEWLFSLVVSNDGGEQVYLKKLVNNRKDRPFFYKCLSKANAGQKVIPLLLLEEDTLQIGLHGLIHFKASDEGHWDERGRQLQQLKTNEAWEEGLSFFAYTVQKQETASAAATIVEILEWFYREIRKPPLHPGRSYDNRSEQLTVFLKMLSEMPHHSGENHAFLDDLLPDLLSESERRLSTSDCPLGEEIWPFILWLLEQSQNGGLGDRNHLLEAFVEKVPALYETTFSNITSYNRWIEIIEKEIESPAWKVIADIIYKKSRRLWNSLLMPVDFEQWVILTDKASFAEKQAYAGKVRTHIRLLSYFVIHLTNKESVADVERNLKSLLIHFQRIAPLQGGIDVFDTLYENNIFIGQRGAKVPLFKRVSEVINQFGDQIRETTISELLTITTDIHRLSLLHNIMSREQDKIAIMAAINKITVEASIENIAMFPDAQRMVTEMLNTGSKEIAEKAREITNHFRELAHKRHLLDWMEWEFRESLRIGYILGDTEAVLNAVIPEELKKKDSVIRGYNFYRGIVLLDSDNVQEIQEAIVIFRQLRKNDPKNNSYGINLLVASTRLLEKKIELAGKNSDEIRQTVEELDRLFHEVKSELDDNDNGHGMGILVENYLFMFILTADWIAFWHEYNQLDEELKLQLLIGRYAVKVYMEQKSWEQASSLLQKLIERHGSSNDLEQLQQGIASKKAEIAYQAPSPWNHSIDWKSVGAARVTLKGLPVFDQAKAYMNDENAKVRDVLVEEVLQACNHMKSMAPTLLKYTNNGNSDKAEQGQEDHYNDILSILLNQSLKALGWSSSTQTRGGYTDNPQSHTGGIGERDIIVKDSDSQELTIIEALRLKNLDRESIRTHFRKTFRYDPTDANFYFLITWGFNDNPAELWEKYKNAIREWKEGDFSIRKEGALFELFPYLNREWPLSLYTKHQASDGRDIHVIHLYVDVKMESKRNLK